MAPRKAFQFIEIVNASKSTHMHILRLNWLLVMADEWTDELSTPPTPTTPSKKKTSQRKKRRWLNITDFGVNF